MSAATDVISPPSTPNRKRKHTHSSKTPILDFQSSCQFPKEERHPYPALVAPQPRAIRATSLISNDAVSCPRARESLTSRATSPHFDQVSPCDDISPQPDSPQSKVAQRLSTLHIEKPNGDPVFQPESPLLLQSYQTGQSESHSSLVLDVREALVSASHPTLEQHDSGPPKKRVPPPRSISSPPPKGARTPSRNRPDMSQSSSSSPLSAIEPSTPSKSNHDLHHWIDLSPQTWQDSEITGHMMLDSDDDGYGINGIGFKPTAAMAIARSRTRKQQMSAWKTREEKEERERRLQKRRQLRHFCKLDENKKDNSDFLSINEKSQHTPEKKIVRFSD